MWLLLFRERNSATTTGQRLIGWVWEQKKGEYYWWRCYPLAHVPLIFPIDIQIFSEEVFFWYVFGVQNTEPQEVLQQFCFFLVRMHSIFFLGFVSLMIFFVGFGSHGIHHRQVPPTKCSDTNQKLVTGLSPSDLSLGVVETTWEIFKKKRTLKHEEVPNLWNSWHFFFWGGFSWLFKLLWV